MAAIPKNLNILVQRLANFNRQTIRVRAMSNDTAGPGQTVVFRFPSNTIIDLQNLQLKATLNSQWSATLAAGTVSTAGAANKAYAADGSLNVTAATATAALGPNQIGTVISELGMPKFSQGLIERFDVTIGGQQITASNVDYGALYTILREHLEDCAAKKVFGDIALNQEDPEYVQNTLHLYQNYAGQASNMGRNLSKPNVTGSNNATSITNGSISQNKYVKGTVFAESAGGNPWNVEAYCKVTATGSTTVDNTGASDVNFDGMSWSVPTGRTTRYLQKPIVWQGFLGFVGGKFARFIDTSITGSIELRIRIAPLAVTYGAMSPYQGCAPLTAGQRHPNITNVTGDFFLSNMYMIMDTISFTDDFYRRILAERLIGGGSIVIPFDNYFSVQKMIAASSDTVTFNIATQSLDYLIGTLRRADYMATPSSVGYFDANIQGNISQYIGATGLVEQADNGGLQTYGNYPVTAGIQSASLNSNYYTFVSGCPNNSQVNPNTTYQWMVANQLVPTWPADVNDVWILNQAALDVASSLGGNGNVQSHFEWRRGKFAHITCFNHHSDTEKFISGLDTRGASANMMWTVSGLDTTHLLGSDASTIKNYMATVWGVCTSTISISAGQNITVIF